MRLSRPTEALAAIFLLVLLSSSAWALRMSPSATVTLSGVNRFLRTHSSFGQQGSTTGLPATKLSGTYQKGRLTNLFTEGLNPVTLNSLLRRQATSGGDGNSATAKLVPTTSTASPCNIKVIGVGGGGGNAVMRMIETGVGGVEFLAVNTDLQALSRFGSLAQTLNIGREVTRGLGAGGQPENGRLAAEESRQDILRMVSGSDLVFVTAGMGGGTGSGAAPVVAEIARDAGALTVGVVTKPFAFEGRRRMAQALEAIETLRGVVDTLIIVSNDRLLQIIDENTPVQRAFSVADDVLRQGVVGISEIIIRPGLINVDFADVRSVMGRAGTALMGIGRGSGKSRAEAAAAAAISSPLLDFPIEKAKGAVFNIVGGPDLTLQEINAAAEVIYEAVDSNANIIFGALVDESMAGEVAITVIATGFPLGRAEEEAAARRSGNTGLRSLVSSVPQRLLGGTDTSPKSVSTPVEKSLPRSGGFFGFRRSKSTDKSNSGDSEFPDFLSQLRR